ncbi:flagellar protein FlaG [Lysinibacillus sp. NPDC097279]|uniref:flagellar protein FlaG n=1 Tax=Lysinibacillus sp. NPDC097279 TaxID=3364143 RepID=UPI0038288739
MRIVSQNTEISAPQNLGSDLTRNEKSSYEKNEKNTQIANKNDKSGISNKQLGLGKSELSFGDLQQAVTTVNEFLEVDHRQSKFILHEGLEKYYIRLVDSDTEEVIKEIPPEKLLDAFYEMQKLVGMIVDEKI